jgi:hypothetical protein
MKQHFYVYVLGISTAMALLKIGSINGTFQSPPIITDELPKLSILCCRFVKN